MVAAASCVVSSVLRLSDGSALTISTRFDEAIPTPGCTAYWYGLQVVILVVKFSAT